MIIYLDSLNQPRKASLIKKNIYNNQGYGKNTNSSYKSIRDMQRIIIHRMEDLPS